MPEDRRDDFQVLSVLYGASVSRRILGQVAHSNAGSSYRDVEISTLGFAGVAIQSSRAVSRVASRR